MPRQVGEEISQSACEGQGTGQDRKSLAGLSHKPLSRGRLASCLHLLLTPTWGRDEFCAPVQGLGLSEALSAPRGLATASSPSPHATGHKGLPWLYQPPVRGSPASQASTCHTLDRPAVCE